MELSNCKCGGSPVRFATKSGGNGIRCDSCKREYSHPEYSWEELAGVWNYANSQRNTEGE